MIKLSNRQKMFCREYVKVEGTIGDAYAKAYDTKNINSANTNGSRLLKKPYIQEYINMLQNKIAKQDFLQIEDKRQLLREFAMSEDDTKADRIKAIEVDNKMTGVYVDKHIVDVDNKINITLND